MTLKKFNLDEIILDLQVPPQSYKPGQTVLVDDAQDNI